MPMNLDSLATLYLRGTKGHAGLTAYMTVNNLVKTDPEQAWQFILRVLARAKDDHELAYIGAGVLEDFLHLHGLDFVGRVDEVWKRNDKMRRAMSCVWLSRMSFLSFDICWQRMSAPPPSLPSVSAPDTPPIGRPS